MQLTKITALFVLSLSLVGCTISFQNVMTSGKAEDLIDEQQTTSPDVHPDTNLSVPLSSI